MKLIIVSNKHNRSRHVTVGTWTKAVLSVCLLGVPATAGFFAGQWTADSENSELLNQDTIHAWQSKIDAQQEQVEALIEREQLTRLAVESQLASMSTQLLRIEALGEHLTDIAGVDSDEFDFSQPPAMGGPLTATAEHQDYAPTNYASVDSVVTDFATLLNEREDQLYVLESLVRGENQQRETTLAGRPITHGWLSSRFGYRNDPFTGRRTWHNGVDFAGRDGSDVVSVAAGVVTWAGNRYGYGNLIEINHGNGLVTRYGHNKELKVDVGDVVTRRQVIAAMGSSGRSTGPHVHFEVYKNGRAVDPAAYINRTLR